MTTPASCSPLPTPTTCCRRATDFPPSAESSLENHPSPINPLGAKGAGEGGIIPVGGIIANAVASALVGVEPRELPLSPPRIWQLIADAAKKR